MTIWIDLTFFITETLMSRRLRGIQRTMLSLSLECQQDTRFGFCAYLQGEYRTISAETVRDLRTADATDIYAFSAVFGFDVEGQGRAKKKSILSPAIQSKIKPSSALKRLEKLLFGLARHKDLKKRYFITPGPAALPLTDFSSGDALLEMGLPKEPGKHERIRNLKERGVKFVFFCHDIFFAAQSYLFRKPNNHYVREILPLMSLANLILTPTYYTRNSLIEWWPAIAKQDLIFTPIQVIPWSGLLPDCPNPQAGGEESSAPPTHQIPQGPFFISLGALEPRKNYMVVLKALETMEPAPNWTYLIIGSQKGATQNEKDLIKKLQAKGWNIELRPNVSDAELQTLLKQAKFMVHPALIEGFGLPPLEAHLFGTPALISDAIAHQELYPEFDFFDRIDPKSCAEKLEIYMRASTGDNKPVLRSTHLETRSWKQVASEISTVINDLPPS